LAQCFVFQLTAEDSEPEPGATASEVADISEEDHEQAERERLEAEQAEIARAAKERVLKEKAEKERAAKERVAKERAAKERAAKDRAAKEKAANEKAAREKAIKERAEKERAQLLATASPHRKSSPKPGSSYVTLFLDFFVTSLHFISSPSQSSSRKSNGESTKTNRISSEGSRESASQFSIVSLNLEIGPLPEQTRIWHDRSGQFRVEAAFLGFQGGKLRLHKVNGVVVEVPAEKMSVEDMRYVEKLTSRKKASSNAPPTPSEDNEPPAERRKTDSSKRPTSQTPKAPSIDWFEFFLNAGCDVDDCTRYATSFEKDKMDESILLDITDATMRSLGLREGDIIRVTKVIEKRKAQENKASTRQEQILLDEAYARQLQAEGEGETARKQNSTSPAPNLFAGPGGALKNAVRRGRPQPSKSLLSSAVDLNAISTASDQIKPAGSPKVANVISSSPVSSSPASVSKKPSLTVQNGFDEDAWTIRPSSTKPLAPTPPAAPTPSASARPASTPASTPAQQPPASGDSSGSSLANTTQDDIFAQLSRLSQLNTNKQPTPSPAPAPAPSVVTPPASFRAGLGMSSSPVPMGQHLVNQQTGYIQSPQQIGPRGPFAPVPANQSLLQPLIPTNSAFNTFVPTRPSNIPPPVPPSLSPFSGGVQYSQSLVPQPTGAAFGGFSTGNSFQSSGFGPVQTSNSSYLHPIDAY
jgi:actin cytoskeleton-regulatory complex protein SLA1